MKKNVDRSFLTQGFTIQKSEWSMFEPLLSKDIDLYTTTVSSKIKLKICDYTFDASIVKEKQKYTYFQVRYDANQQITFFLQKAFNKIWDYVSNYQTPNTRKIPDNIKEEVQIIPYPEENLCEIYLPPIILSKMDNNMEDEANNVSQEELKEIQEFSEFEFEDINTKVEGYKYSLRIQKSRNDYIQNGKKLKILYKNRCQITGKRIGDEFGVNAVEVHHIKPFCESLNSNFNNLVIISPDFHRIIHQANATFDYETLEFIINGKRVKLKLNYHLHK